MSDPLSSLSSEARHRLRQAPLPEWIDPMLATLTDQVFSDAGWIYERKLDGERCLVFREGGRVRLRSRNRKDIAAGYPELVEALQDEADHDLVADGEIVAFEKGVTSFARLQKRMQIKDPERARQTGVAVYLYLFDLMHLDEFDLTGLKLRDRKATLRRAVRFDDPIRFTFHRNRDGAEYHRQACEKGWEGLLAKNAASQYVHTRSRSWLKMKCVHTQELVVGGFTDPQGSRIGFGALLVGYYDKDALRYAGKVGTGFDNETLRNLHHRLTALERETPPFDGESPRSAHWVSPRLVAQIAFTEWTQDGKLRHPRFVGLRRDKDPEDVVRERPS